MRLNVWIAGGPDRSDEDGLFECAMQLAEQDYIAGSAAAQTVIAENCVGLPV